MASSAIVAFAGACFAHEVVGHGGGCLIGSGIVAQVSSSLFACRPGTLLADLGGPGANLVVGLVGLVGLIALRRRQCNTDSHLVLALGVAFNMFWVAGALLMSAVVASDDFAYAARMFGPAQFWVRAAFGAAGIGLALATCRLMGDQGLSRSTLRLAYCVTGVAVCVSAGFYAGPVGPALREAALESFGAMAWLLCIHPRSPKSDVGVKQ